MGEEGCRQSHFLTAQRREVVLGSRTELNELEGEVRVICALSSQLEPEARSRGV